ncbi:DapH/DapD/GlmU-related protein [Algoriphagus sp. CAU 1675]|uniref:DapH/DapD/GlmU-related protein n=1 Tax=Algoriphagus sp. CAU 1675 TaxID=3032597 RepID=UPI0023DA99D5|nr:DapH/DapD/GlmU-related protein [Algoriphagus sp. CAU 1675]MDF2157238.1 DapH/DapD/GlmU-related protein [Algoriphagus sp. CAU 1675]
MKNPSSKISLAEIHQRLISGDVVPITDPVFQVINEECAKTLKLIAQINATGDIGLAHELLSKITGQDLDPTVTLFPPFMTNFGKFTKIGKHVFINHGCSFLDLGGITIEDHVLIGPQVKLVTENHPLNPENRRGMLAKPIVIQKNAWIGAGVTILPGVTIGENAVVAAGAVVSKDVPSNTMVAGIPAKIIKSIEINS